MKKKLFGLGIVCIAVIIGIAGFLLYKVYNTVASNPYKELQSIKLDEFFDKQGEYYVYAQRAGCPYCDNVKDEIINFAKQNDLYVFDTRAKENEGFKDYDWDKHHIEYDQEIGEIVDGEMLLNDGLIEENLKDEFSSVDYTIKKADEEFVELNEGKEVGKVYAIRETPIIDYSDTTSNNLTIPAVPILYHIRDGKIVNYYCGDVPILDLLGSDKKPLDKYIS